MSVWCSDKNDVVLNISLWVQFSKIAISYFGLTKADTVSISRKPDYAEANVVPATINLKWPPPKMVVDRAILLVNRQHLRPKSLINKGFLLEADVMPASINQNRLVQKST